MVGFVLFLIILLTIIIYPLLNPGDPLKLIGVGTFARPGTYFSLYDATGTKTETLKLDDADEKRLAAALSDEDKVSILNLFAKGGLETDVTIGDTDEILELWEANYERLLEEVTLTKSEKRNYRLLQTRLETLKSADTLEVTDTETGEVISTIEKSDYVRVNAVANVKTLVLGTDNFGRDVLKELVSAAGTSLKIGLLAGYLGGWVDEAIMFITTMFTVIPGFVLLILISYSLSQEQRGPMIVAVVIGLTSWTWTCRSVRSQVISLRNRDHVNLSKLSGHSLFRIITTDILPYIASYVVMAFILQVSSGILAEAQLSLLGLGPKTTTTPTLGLMMNWAMLYSAHTNGSWWVYFPVILTIALISFSLNLMNTGMDQVFNPALRE